MPSTKFRKEPRPSLADEDDVTLGELREIARAFHAELAAAADAKVALPGDAWLDAKLRARGCPSVLLAFYRDRIRRMKFAEAFESASIGDS